MEIFNFRYVEYRVFALRKKNLDGEKTITYNAKEFVELLKDNDWSDDNIAEEMAERLILMGLCYNIEHIPPLGSCKLYYSSVLSWNKEIFSGIKSLFKEYVHRLLYSKSNYKSEFFGRTKVENIYLDILISNGRINFVMSTNN